MSAVWRLQPQHLGVRSHRRALGQTGISHRGSPQGAPPLTTALPWNGPCGSFHPYVGKQ